MPINNPRRVAVVGGGITGLAAALRLAAARATGESIEEYLFESDNRLGGVLFSDRADGCVVEAGPDSFLTEKPQALELARELGIAGDVIGSNDGERRTYILHRGRLVTLPDGLMFLVPTKLLPMATTPLIPFGEKLKILGEWFHPKQPVHEESVASFISRHFGPSMVDNLADPLLSGVYGGDADQLSVQATLPRFAEMERTYGSLIRGVLDARRKMRRAPGRSGPLFSTMRSGLSQFVTRIQERLPAGRIHLGQAVSAIEVSDSTAGGCAYRLYSGQDFLGEFDAVILALPAHVSGRLLADIDPVLAKPLDQFPYSSSMTVVLGYPAAVRAQLPPGFGFLVPRKEGRRMLACTFVHAKFPQRVPEDRALVRCFLGGSRDPGVLDLDDTEVTRIVRDELRHILGLQAEPLFVRIYRWRRAMAQYALGHGARVAAVQDGAARHPGLFLAGNWESGIGISDCIRSGSIAAMNCTRYLHD